MLQHEQAARRTRVERPESLDAFVAAMRRAADAHETVAVAGGGTASSYGLTEALPVDVEIDTRALTRVVSYAPGDLIIEVEAGITIAAINELVARDGLRLALDPPEAERATIGGAVACNAFGPRRARYGSLRDLVVGMSLVRADGTLVRGGGRVVKNVAGFDIPKLAIGSLGTLGAIATVTLRLHPLPAASAALFAACPDLETVVRLERALEAERLEPAATLATKLGRTERSAADWRYAVVFEGFPAGVEEQTTRAAALAERLGIRLERGEAADELRADGGVRNGTNVLLQISLPRTSLAELDAMLDGYPSAADEGTSRVAFPALGIAFVTIDVRRSESLVALLAKTRERAEALGGHLVVIDGDGLRGAFDAFGSPPAAAGLMRALRARFDPERRLNPHRAVGGL